MSEFTTGILYPRKYEAHVLRFLPMARQPYFHKNVNDEWNAFFLEDEWLETAATVQFVRALSSQFVPLLWFHDAEDSGWGYRLFDGGQEVSSATISYSLDVELAEAELRRRYPGVELDDELVENEALREEYEETLEWLIRSESYRQEVWKGIARFRPQHFSRLVSTKQVQQLRTLFDVNLLTEVDDETGHAMLYDSVDMFKEILGIEEMIWVSYSYLASGGRE